jgi:hypothetical protein
VYFATPILRFFNFYVYSILHVISFEMMIDYPDVGDLTRSSSTSSSSSKT